MLKLFFRIFLAAMALVAASSSLVFADEGAGITLSKNISPLVANGTAQYIGPITRNRPVRLTIHLADLGENTQEALKPVKFWLDDTGFIVENISSDYRSIEVLTSIMTINKVLKVEIGNYQYEMREYFSNDKPPTIPDYLKGIVVSIDGLDNITHLHHE